MKGLLVKDFCLIKEMRNYLGVVMFMAIFLMVASKGQNTAFVLGYITILFSFMVMNTMTYDEHENGYMFLLTLPISRRGYVVGKYVFGLVLGLTGWLSGIILVILCRAVFSPQSSLQEPLFEGLALLAVLIVVEAVMLPLQLKFGSDKGRTMLIVLIMLIFILAYFSNKVLDMAGMSLDGIISALSRIPVPAMATLGILILLLMMGISIMTSFHIMEKKEF